MPSEILAVAFDAFGTLIDYPVKRFPYNLLCPPDADKTVFRRHCMTTDQTPAEIAAAFGRTAFLPEFERLFALEQRSIALYAEVPQLLADLQQKGIKTAVCSNLAQAYGGILKTLLPDIPCVLSYETSAAKPETAFYQAVEQTLNLPRGNILFVGDNFENDFAAPARFGFQTARFDRRKDSLRTLLMPSESPTASV